MGATLFEHPGHATSQFWGVSEEMVGGSRMEASARNRKSNEVCRAVAALKRERKQFPHSSLSLPKQNPQKG